MNISAANSKNRIAIMLIVVLLILIIGIALYGWFINTFEKRSEMEYRGFGVAAIQQPYALSVDLLKSLERPVDTGRTLPKKPARDDTILLFTKLDTTPASEIERLLEWVDLGGHLVVQAYESWDDADVGEQPVLERLNVEPYIVHSDLEDESETDDSEISDGSASDGDETQQAADSKDTDTQEFNKAESEALNELADLFGQFNIEKDFEVVSVQLDTDKAELKVHFSTHLYLDDVDGDAWHWAGREVDDDYIWPHLLQYRLGDGVITVLSDTMMLTNGSLHELDHAKFLVALTSEGNRNGKIWLRSATAAPSLLSLLLEHAAAVLFACIVFITLWCWRTGRRFGPTIEEPKPERRALLEHVKASGNWLWRQGRSDELLAATRKQIRRKAALRHPSFRSLDDEQQSVILAELTELNPEAVADAMHATAKNGEHFRSLSETLQQLRSRL